MRLRCSNPECESRIDPDGVQPLFTINVTVDSDRDLAESLNRRSVDAECFTCCYCHDVAEEVDGQ